MCSSITENQEDSGGGNSTGQDGRETVRVGTLNLNGAARTSNSNLTRRNNPRRSNGVHNSNTSSKMDDVKSSNSDIMKVMSIRRRTIYVFYFMAFLDLMAVSSFLPLMTLSIRKLGATPFMTGLIGSVYGGIQLISSPVVGWGSDIYGQKFILCICLIASASAYVIQGLAVTISLLLVARIMAGIFKHSQTVGKSIVSEMSSRDKSYVIGNFNAFGSMGFIVGPTIGAHIAQMENGFQMISFFCATAFLINAVLVILLVPDPATLKLLSPPNTLKGAQTKDRKNDEKKSIFENADFHAVLLLLVRFLFSFATLTFRENLTIVLQDKYNSNIVNSGYLTSLQALVSTVLSFCVGPINAHICRGNSFYMVVCAGILKCAVLFTLFYSTTFWVAATMLVVVSGLNPFLRVGVTALSLEGHQNEVGIILGLSQSANSLARMFSPTAAGIAIGMSTDGPFLLGAMSAVFGVIATLIAQRYARSSGKQTLHPKTD